MSSIFQWVVYRAVLVSDLQHMWKISCYHEMALCSLLCHPSDFPSQTLCIFVAVMSELCLIWPILVKAVEKVLFHEKKKITTNNIQSSIHAKSGYFWTILFIKSTLAVKSCYHWPVVSSKTTEGDLSDREVILIWGDHSAGGAELDWIFLIDSVTHNVSIRASWRIPLYFHLVKQTTNYIKLDELET